MRFVWCAALLALSLGAQEPTFEVASVKPSANLQQGSSIHNDRGGFEAKNTTLHELIRYALGAQDFQITGGPAWVKDARFDVKATNDRAEDVSAGPADVKTNEARFARIRARLRHLLEDRFQLELREEQREVPVYALSIDKGGPKMKAVAEPLGNVNLNTGKAASTVSGKGLTMPRLCQILSGLVERPVTDETGLAGAFDVELKYAPDSDASDTPGGVKEAAMAFPSLFTAVKEQLGLRLTGKKGQATTWVVVRAEKPSEN